MTDRRKGFIERHGRKFFLSLVSLVLGTIVTVYGIDSAKRSPASAPNIAGIATAFAGIIVACISAFTAGNSYVSGKALDAGKPGNEG